MAATYGGLVSVVRRDAQRRWALVGGGVAALCLLPVAIAAWPAPDVAADPRALHTLILRSAAQPHEGYLDSLGTMGFPDLPALDEVNAMLGGSTRMRVWYASAESWRVAVLSRTGERDLYRLAGSTFVWDFERNQLTQVAGELPVRLPWAADLTPPELARRLLGQARGDEIARIGSRRVAGVLAAGLRLTPADPDTSIGRVDVWADPTTGLPVQVEVAGRGGGTVFTSRFLQLRQEPPDPAVLKPKRPASAGYTVTTAPDIVAAVNSSVPTALPARLGGRPRAAVSGDIAGVAGYGTGLARFVVLPLPGRIGYRSLNAARRAGAAPVPFDHGEGYEMRSSVLTALIVRATDDPFGRRTFMLAGLVSQDLLRKAAVELLALVRSGQL
jgi:hypothetical protein